MKGVRFAPSPTGRFHIGNLRTAWIASRIGHLLAEPPVHRLVDLSLQPLGEAPNLLIDDADVDIHAGTPAVPINYAAESAEAIQQTVVRISPAHPVSTRCTSR